MQLHPHRTQQPQTPTSLCCRKGEPAGYRFQPWLLDWAECSGPQCGICKQTPDLPALKGATLASSAFSCSVRCTSTVPKFLLRTTIFVPGHRSPGLTSEPQRAGDRQVHVAAGAKLESPKYKPWGFQGFLCIKTSEWKKVYLLLLQFCSACFLRQSLSL